MSMMAAALLQRYLSWHVERQRLAMQDSHEGGVTWKGEVDGVDVALSIARQRKAHVKCPCSTVRSTPS